MSLTQSAPEERQEQARSKAAIEALRVGQRLSRRVLRFLPYPRQSDRLLVCDGGERRSVMIPGHRRRPPLSTVRQIFVTLSCLIVSLGATGCRRQYSEGVWLAGEPTRSPLLLVPQLAWPPAKWTTSYDVGEVHGLLGEAAAKIRDMLRDAGLEDCGIFAIDDNGFAVVTRVESITNTGQPREDPGRFNYDDAGRVTGGGFLDALLNRRPGRYRDFAIVVTSRPVVSGATKETFVQAGGHYHEGAAHLPASLAQVHAPPGSRMTILVYEFYRPTPIDEQPSFVENSQLSAKQHIIGAGLLRSGAFER